MDLTAGAGGCFQVTVFYDPDIPVPLQRDQDLCHQSGVRRAEIRADRVTVTCPLALPYHTHAGKVIL